jgi:hypothetical protein
VSKNRTFGPGFWFPEAILSIKHGVLNTQRGVLNTQRGVLNTQRDALNTHRGALNTKNRARSIENWVFNTKRLTEKVVATIMVAGDGGILPPVLQPTFSATRSESPLQYWSFPLFLLGF